MLKFKPGYMNGRGSILEYAEHIWTMDAGSVLEFAREGLADLVASGFKYFESEASKKSVVDWQGITDSVVTYFEDLRTGEWKIPAALEGREWELGSTYYSDFREWAAASGRKPTGKHNFYRELSDKMKFERDSEGKGGCRFKVLLGRISEARVNPTQIRNDLSARNDVEF
jgi:hypothetical protein